jgi:hypothetical protein
LGQSASSRSQAAVGGAATGPHASHIEREQPIAGNPPHLVRDGEANLVVEDR